MNATLPLLKNTGFPALHHSTLETFQAKCNQIRAPRDVSAVPDRAGMTAMEATPRDLVREVRAPACKESGAA